MRSPNPLSESAFRIKRIQMGRNAVLLMACSLTILVFGPALKTVLGLALHDDRYLQIAVGPLACGLLLFWRRTEIFSNTRSYSRGGILVFSIALLIGMLARFGNPGSDETNLRFAVLALVLMWISTFALCFGARSFRVALYPLCCLFLMIPLPRSWMDWIASALQHGSAALSYEMLRWSGIPVFHSGTLFSLPGLDFEVAPECSGIRSSLALVAIAIVAGYIYLRSGLSRFVLVLMTIPIALFKNAIRIDSIALLGAYVDRVFITGSLHHRYGGLLFSVVAVALFVPLLGGLQKIEGRFLAERVREWRSRQPFIGA
jgi:exosortase